MATTINTPSAGEIWHLSIEDLFTPVQAAPRLGGDGPFVINLSVSTAPINIPQNDFASCEGAHVYQIQVMEDGRTRYRLRLGPFADEDTADGVLQQVREIYPGALTATASTVDLRSIDSIQAKLDAKKIHCREATDKSKLPAEVSIDASLPRDQTPAPPVASPPLDLSPDWAVSESKPSTFAELVLDLEVGSVPQAPPPPVILVAPQVAPAFILELQTTESKLSVSKTLHAKTVAPAFMPSAPLLTEVVTLARRVETPAAQSKAMAAKAAAQRAADAKAVAEAKAAAEARALEAAAAVKKAAEAKAAEAKAAEIKAAAQRAAEAKAAEVMATALKAATLKAAARKPATHVAATNFSPVFQSRGTVRTPAAKASGNSLVPRLTSLQHVVVGSAPVPAKREVKQLSAPLPDLESTQTIRPLTPPELEDAEASRYFVIQLSSAETAFDPDAVPNLDIFGEYRLYSVASQDQGRTVHALRLGFFTEEIAAVMVASYLADYYDKPTIKRVSVAERERFVHQRVEARKDIGATGRHSVIEITDELVARRKRVHSAASDPGHTGVNDGFPLR